MSQPELLKHVVRQLEAAGVEDMVSGLGRRKPAGRAARASHDIDIVVAVRAPAVEVAS